MKLRALPASEFISFLPAHREMITQYGGVAVNDALLPIWEDLYDILLLYGGRGGGKSEAVCDKLLDECLNEPYFKCYYGRKVFETVRGSCFATLVYCIKKNKLEHLFSFSEADSSSMIITCKLNGNKFIPFGSDKADKLKSIKDPTVIWGEEFDQFTMDDFKEFYPTLRTIRGKNQLICTFNTHGVLLNHWLIKVFFPHLYEGLDKEDVIGVDLLEGKRVKQLFVNFTDNYFIDQHAYRQILWLSAAGSITVFEGIANGAWGVMVNDSPWAYAFSAAKHVGRTAVTLEEPLYLSWDFNRNPITCSVIQDYNNHTQVIETIKLPKSGVDAMCEYILQNYPGFVYIVTGDYSGMTETSLFKEQVTHYSMIKAYLNLSDGQIVVRPNPRLEKNSTLVNTVLTYRKLTMDSLKARPLIYDCMNVKKRADGTILKDNRDDPTQQADALDTLRYFINNFLNWFKPTADMITAQMRKQMETIAVVKQMAPPEKQGLNVVAKAMLAIYNGKKVDCTIDEYYLSVRQAIITQAAKWIDAGNTAKAQIALDEVKRLDKIYTQGYAA